MARSWSVPLVAALAVVSAVHAQSAADPSLDSVIQRMGAYVANYGETASHFVGVERYVQSVTIDGTPPIKPRQLVAEFAIIKVGDSGWMGFRDVVAVDGKKIPDRQDRLLSLVTDESADLRQFTRIANESARFNIGPIRRNFNVPTAALFVFQPANLSRFTFKREDPKTIEGVATWEIQFKETRRPTFVMTGAGRDVPIEGSIWVVPGNGTVVQTRLRMRNFADVTTSFNLTRIDSAADVEVTYRPDEKLRVWLPVRMVELYTGPITWTGRPPAIGRAATRATYSDFKQFGTSVKIK